jgi:uncharacterized protein (TIGR00251 family)
VVQVLNMPRFTVHVKPRSSRQGVNVLPDGTLEIRVHSPPEDGRANTELMEVLARHLGVKRRRLSIVSGETSRHKIIEVRD